MTKDHLFTPFKPLFMHAFRNIAPERYTELSKDQSITIDIFPAAEFIAESVSGERLMRFSTGALELYWCMAYLNFVTGAEYPLKQEAQIDPWDLMAEKRTREAVLLVKWVLDKNKSKKESPWPPGFPRPDLSAQEPTDVYFANELFLKSMAFVLHHERAHIELGHLQNIGSAALPNEKEADRMAAEWILGKAPTSQVLEARAFGIVSAMLAGYRTELHQNAKDGSHPDPFERIDQCVSTYIKNPDAPVNWLTAILIQVHGSIATKQQLAADAENSERLVQEFMIVVTRASRTLSNSR